MKLCFNQATTMKYSNLEKDLELCEKHGYDLIEIRLDKLKDYLKTHEMQDLVDFFKNSRIRPFAFNALEFISFRDSEGYRQIKEDLVFLCETGKLIGCKKIVVVPTFDIGEYTKEEIAEETARVLNDLADTAEGYDVKLAFELVGYPNCSVNTFGQAYDIIKRVDRDSVGLVLDCFHFHAMGSRLEDLRMADPKKIFIFHIDDSEDLPVGALRDHNRLWPGEGAVDLDGILSILKQLGYDEMVSIEMFRPEYWEWETEKIIATGKQTTEAEVGKYFEME
ncbi:MAG: sugar phosphate isomerase/epimerase family protein [Christensenellales bacterium]|jgi:2-keto-myo-inositol isomerase